MKSVLDNETTELTCPHCGHKFRERFGKLKTNPTLACAKCKGVITVDADQLRRVLERQAKALADLQRKAGRLFK